MAELSHLADWCDGLLQKLSASERRQLVRQIATDLRRANVQRIAQQVTPEGEAFAPRKPNKLREKKGQIRKRMFTKLRMARNLKAGAKGDEASVTFAGRAQWVARVHHYGLRDKVKRGGPEVTYVARPLLGLSDADRKRVTDLVLANLVA
ncbi:phage virion morphogenesis protein [Chitinimonas sp. BJB300]|uniref:phage virion morphogenesis protein n=1 Tax=Chitinimonas sp. BJB300 TaxID=1559339 RepID=UPI000C105633|nr:phage virion morphogenesis protein [Chitinimonas sp. BJB300]PHV11318.1 phage virion morphogenesis protein [Chitinimonas sp. BJB300]TSJ88213.1 phage virion morphogenesis protein [Chitinimonas sp. BJB300]